MSEKTTIKIEFDSKEAADHFATWLCEAGEQDYWNWQEYREQEEDGDITAITFNYHPIIDETKSEDDEDRYGEFMADNTITTVLGRLDK